MKHCYLFSIKNRFKYFKSICETIVSKYQNKDTEIVLSVTDFNSDDADIELFLKSLNVSYFYKNMTQKFNLGLGWNTAAHHNCIKDTDVLIFITNDAALGNDFDICETIKENTIIGKKIFIPVHGCQDRSGSIHFAGGACLWSLYKADFKKIGDIPESETWSDCAKLKKDSKVPQYSWLNENSHVGEDDFVVFNAIKNGYDIVRQNDSRIIARWHPRDLDDEWYGNSECLVSRGYLKSSPKWWNIT